MWHILDGIPGIHDGGMHSHKRTLGQCGPMEGGGGGRHHQRGMLQLMQL